MATAADWYVQEIHSQLKYYAAWEPYTTFELGSYGTVEAGLFRHEGTLVAMGGPTSEAHIEELQPVRVYSTDGAVDMAIGAAGGVAAPGARVQTQVKLAFTREKAIYCRFVNYRRVSIKNIEEVRRFVLDIDAAGIWNRAHVVVTEVVQAEQGIVLFSSSKGDNVCFEVEGEHVAMDLADPSLKLKLKSGKAIGLSYEMNKLFTPLLGLKHVKARLFGISKFEVKRLASATDDGETVRVPSADFIPYVWEREDTEA